MADRREKRLAQYHERVKNLTEERKILIREQLEDQMEHDIRGKGWTMIPIAMPHVDMPLVLEYVDQMGWLDRMTLALVPSESPPGEWELILTSIALTVTKAMTKTEPDPLDAPGMDTEPPVPYELEEIRAETRFPDNPKRCMNCDHFNNEMDDETTFLGCIILHETDPAAYVCRAFFQTRPNWNSELSREEI